jgi:hypothetical protein
MRQDGNILIQEEILEKASRIIVVVLDIYSLNQSSSLTLSVSLIRRRPCERLFTNRGRILSAVTIYLEPIRLFCYWHAANSICFPPHVPASSLTTPTFLFVA